jgi:hypothetical protein
MAIFADAQNGQRLPLGPEQFVDQSCTDTARNTLREEEGVTRWDEIRMRVRLAVGCMLPSRSDKERRCEHRYQFPYPISMTPVDAKGKATGEPPFVVIGRHLSEQGMDFYSKEVIPYRYLVASLPIGEEQSVGMLVDLSWCRFGHHGWYENGGKFTEVVD